MSTRVHTDSSYLHVGGHFIVAQSRDDLMPISEWVDKQNVAHPIKNEADRLRYG